MKVTIRDMGVLSRIPPREVAAYLRARDWHLVDRKPNVWSVWLPKGAPEQDAEILLPLDASLADFALRMSEVLAALERREERSQSEILKDIENITGDVIRIRLDSPSIQGGAAPLEIGINLVQGGRDLLAAAACSTINPKAYHLARRPAQASEYLEKLHLGQTEQGSYVVTVISRVPPDLQRVLPLFGEVEEPFERRVTLTLVEALSRTRDAAELAASSGTLAAFEEGIQHGVSANLCDAITLVGDDSTVRRVDINVSWAPIRPAAREIPTRVAFPQDTISIIKEASRLLKVTAPFDDVELRGYVYSLKREPGELVGTVRVVGLVDGTVRNVSLALPESDYEAASDAHIQEREVICRGNILKESNAYVMKPIYHFGPA